MSEGMRIRWGWMKFMYCYTIVVAGAAGLGTLFAPRMGESMLGFPHQDPITYGINGSVYVAFAILSVFGLRSPLKFAPVLLLQLSYKVVWIICVTLPILVAGRLPTHGIILAVIFATFVIGDLIAIPFRYVFSKD